MTVSMDDIKTLREKTGAGIMDAKKALEEAAGNMKTAEEIIAKKGILKAEKKADRETSQGIVGVYAHHNGRSAAMVKLLCETDFVAKTDDFIKLAKELAMQVVSMQPENVEELLKQPYMRDPKVLVGDMVKQVAGKVGENIQVGEFSRIIF